MENNVDYFDSVVPIRFFGFLILSILSYFSGVSILNSPLVFSYAVLETVCNGLMMVET